MTKPVNVTLDVASYGMPVPEFIDWIRGGLGGEFSKVADDIQAQVRSEEPLGFGTIVQVASGMLVVRVGAAMRNPWHSGDDSWNWEDLDNPQLYRIGLTSADDPHSDLEYASRLDGSTMPAPRVLPNEFCWCGGEVGARTPGDHLGLGCLADVTHDWTAASRESQDLIETEAGGLKAKDAWRGGYEQATKHTRERIYNRVARLKPQLITAVEKTTIDKALAEIEKDADDTVTGRGCPS